MRARSKVYAGGSPFSIQETFHQATAMWKDAVLAGDPVVRFTHAAGGDRKYSQEGTILFATSAIIAIRNLDDQRA